MHKTMIELVHNRVTSALSENSVSMPTDAVDVLIIGHGSKDPNAKRSMEYVVEEREDQIWFDGWGNWGGLNNWNVANASNPPQIITKPDGSEQIVAGGMLWGGSHTANNSTWFQENELVSTGLNAEWLGDVWKVNADIVVKHSITSLSSMVLIFFGTVPV